MEIREKGKQEELNKAELQDIRYLEKMLEKIKVEDENEASFLKKQISQLTNDKIRLQQHVISLISRVNNSEMDICEKTGEHKGFS